MKENNVKIEIIVSIYVEPNRYSKSLRQLVSNQIIKKYNQQLIYHLQLSS